jgi:ATP-binding cassette subfamily B protein
MLRRVAKYLRPYSWLALANIACAALAVAASFIFPQLLQYIIDDVIAKGAVGRLPFAILMLLIAFLLRDVFAWLRILVNNVFEQHVIFDLRCALFQRLQRLPVEFFDARASGDLMTRIMEDVGSFERILIDGTEQGTIAVVAVFGVATILFLKNPELAWLALVPLPLLLAGALVYTLSAVRLYRGTKQSAGILNAILADSLQGIRQIKAFVREAYEDKRFANAASRLRRETLGVLKIWAAYSPAMTFVASLGTVLVLWRGGFMVAKHAITLGELVGFLFFLTLFYDPLGKLHTLNQLLQSARAASERVFDILDAPEEQSVSNAVWWQGRVRGEVVFEEVSFRYTDMRPALAQISVQALPGEVIALIGPSGAGKSTLVNLLFAFYRPTEGRILIDGLDTALIALPSLRAQIALVSQEPFLFNGTIRENILYGKLGAADSEIIGAAKAANIHEFISRLPQGYDTQNGERGVRLSVGQKQRISIARAILKDAPILILDEATASVDAGTERLIQEALARVMEGRTSFVIAHRLSTIEKATQILVMQGGRIIERGTHAALVKADGLYARMLQAGDMIRTDQAFVSRDPVKWGET